MVHLNNFDASQVEPSVALQPIPAGPYIAIITESESKATKAGDGRYLQLTFQIIEGEHKGRLVWARLNLENKNQTAVEIARAELSAICRAVGVMKPNDSAALHNIPLEIAVGLKRRDDTGELGNVIKGYSKRVSSAATSAVAPTNVPGSPAPWARK